MSAISTDQVQAEIKAAYASCCASDATGNRLFEKWLQERDRVILATQLGQTPEFDIGSSGNEVKSAYTRNFHPHHNPHNVIILVVKLFRVSSRDLTTLIDMTLVFNSIVLVETLHREPILAVTVRCLLD